MSKELTPNSDVFKTKISSAIDLSDAKVMKTLSPKQAAYAKHLESEPMDRPYKTFDGVTAENTAKSKLSENMILDPDTPLPDEPILSGHADHRSTQDKWLKEAAEHKAEIDSTMEHYDTSDDKIKSLKTKSSSKSPKQIMSPLDGIRKSQETAKHLGLVNDHQTSVMRDPDFSKFGPDHDADALDLFKIPDSVAASEPSKSDRIRGAGKSGTDRIYGTGKRGSEFSDLTSEDTLSNDRDMGD